MKWYWKLLLCLGGITVLSGVIFGVFLYNVRVRKTVCGESVSPDGTYTLSLVAVGEAEFPFGPARGELVLKKGKETVVEEGFILYDDGGCIRESCWEVVWKEDMVVVAITGEEQYPEEFILGFDGTVVSRQIVD